MTLDDVPAIEAKAVERNYTERRRIVAGMYIRGQTSTRQLAEVLHVSHTTIERDIKALQKLWQEQAFRAAAELVAEQLAKLDELERVATANYETALRGNVRTTTVTRPNGDVEQRTETMVNHDAIVGWWDRWLKCVTERCRILGVGSLHLTLTSADTDAGQDAGIIGIDANYDSWNMDQLRDEWGATQDRIRAVEMANGIVQGKLTE